MEGDWWELLSPNVEVTGAGTPCALGLPITCASLGGCETPAWQTCWASVVLLQLHGAGSTLGGLGVNWGSGQEAPGMGTAELPPGTAIRHPLLLHSLGAHGESRRDRVVLAEKRKMSKQHSPGSFSIFFLSFFSNSPDKERIFF